MRFNSSATVELANNWRAALQLPANDVFSEVLKTVGRASVPWVRIPPPPLFRSRNPHG